MSQNLIEHAARALEIHLPEDVKAYSFRFVETVLDALREAGALIITPENGDWPAEVLDRLRYALAAFFAVPPDYSGRLALVLNELQQVALRDAMPDGDSR